MRRAISVVFVAFVLLPSLAVTAVRAEGSTEVEALKKQVQSLQHTVEQLQRTLHTMQQETVARDEQLQQKVQQVETTQKQQTTALQAQLESPLDQALKELDAEGKRPVSTDIASRQVGGTNVRLIDISFIPSLLAGSSTATDDELQTLQGGGHDPHKRGYTLAEGELGLAGAVDPYFRAQAYITTFIDALSGETGVELEEAFLTTQSLPYGLQLEVGHFLTEFGQINPRHPHQWDWIDQPVINTRLFGGDGIRAPGMRASWLLPTPWFSELHLGMQNANGEQMVSFLGGRHEHGGEEESEEHVHLEEAGINEEAIGNRPLVDTSTKALRDFTYLARWNNSWSLNDELGVVFGLSGLYGANGTGPDGNTWIYGMDMKWRWRPTSSFRGWPFLIWQTEVMARDYGADRFVFVDEENPTDVITLPGRTLHDWGLYTQLLYGFSHGWATGVRYEYAGGSGESIGGRKNDPFRADRNRVSPLLSWNSSEFTRIRLQYNFDRANNLTDGKDAHSVWLGFQWLYGTHPPHEY